jgi:hypothetical protein
MTNEENKKTETPETAAKAGIMSAMDFARLGDGHIAYVRQLNTGEAARLFPALKGIPEGIDLYALVSADGTPLSLRDNRNSAIADAMEHDLETVSLH